MVGQQHEFVGQCRESWSFSIADYEMRHDEGVYNLSIDVSYSYVPDIGEAYPDWRLVAADIKNFLSSYPTSTHYWEIVNKRLAVSLIQRYEVLASLTIKICVPPLCSNALQRTTTVTIDRSNVCFNEPSASCLMVAGCPQNRAIERAA